MLSIFKITARWRKDRGGRLPSKALRQSVFQNHNEDKPAVLMVVHVATESSLSGSQWTASLGWQVSAHCSGPWGCIISTWGSTAQQWKPPASTSGLISLLTEDARKLLYGEKGCPQELKVNIPENSMDSAPMELQFHWHAVGFYCVLVPLQSSNGSVRPHPWRVMSVGIWLGMRFSRNKGCFCVCQ